MSRYYQIILLIFILLLTLKILDFISSAENNKYDIVILGGKIVDGSGKAAYQADVGLASERIAAIGKLEPSSGERVINAEGLVVAPGFINPHSHSDETIGPGQKMLSALRQGITTEIVGNDGFSAVDIGAYLQKVELMGVPLNYGTFIGHSSVRLEVMGKEPRAPTSIELERMRALVEKGMRDGALGLSSGLEYLPGMFASTEELISLAQAAAAHGGVYVTHLRNERAAIEPALIDNFA